METGEEMNMFPMPTAGDISDMSPFNGCSGNKIASFDFDGVLYNGDDLPALRPGPCDVIITGRSYEEAKFVCQFLSKRNIDNPIFFNDKKKAEKTRESSGWFKVARLNAIPDIVIHYEDDPIQAEIIKNNWHGTVITLDNSLVSK